MAEERGFAAHTQVSCTLGTSIISSSAAWLTPSAKALQGRSIMLGYEACARRQLNTLGINFADNSASEGASYEHHH